MAAWQPLLAFFFATPWMALAVAVGAASIPIIIHLINRKRFRVVTWAAMRFLLAARRKNTRRMRLEQIILLAVRTLIVLFLAAAMASVMPWAEAAWSRLFPGSGVFADLSGRRTHKVLVIDGSFSMALKDGEQTCFDRARAAAAQIVQESSSGDGFSVVLMAAPPRRIVPEPSEDAPKVAAEIDALRLPHGNADLTATLNAVEDLLRKSPDKFEEREVYFLTDLQRSTWTSRQAIDPSAVLEKIRARCRTVFVDVGQDGANNLAVTNLTLNEPPATTSATATFTATIHNYGSEPRQEVRLELLVGKARAAATDPEFQLRTVSQRLINVSAGSDAEPVHFQYKFGTPGDYVVQVRLQEDALELDDVRSAVVSVKETVSVMLVNGKPDAEPLSQATEWLSEALNPFPAGRVPGNVPARPKTITVSDFDDAGRGDLTPYDCVFFCDVKRLSPGEIRRLETHLRRGGGIVFCLGPEVDLEAYNRLLYRDGEGLLPARLLGRQEAPENYAFTFYTDDESFKRPPLAAFSSEKQKGSLMSPRFRQYVRAELPRRSRARKVLSFMPEGLGLQGKSAPDVLPVNDPAVMEWSRYRGRVVLLTTTANMDWTTWPISPSFPAFMQELLRFAVGGRLREQTTVVGDPLEDFLPLGGAGLDVVIHTPEGRTEATRTQDREEAAVLRWADTDVSGIYRAVIGAHPQEHLFAVNVPVTSDSQQACESDLTRTNKEELQATYPGWEFQLVTDVHDVAHSGGPVLEGAERPRRGMGTVIARGLLLALLFLLAIEVVLAWRFGHYSAVQGESSREKGKSGVALLALPFLLFPLFFFLLFALGHAAWTGDFLGFLPESFRRTVEAGLGIPPPAPGEGTRWRLQFSPYLWDAAADPWLAAAIALAAAVLVVAVYFQEGQAVGASYKLMLAGLRMCLVLLALAVLLPQLRLWFERQGWPDIAIIIDDSRSMSALDRYQDESGRAAAERLGQVAALTAPERLQLAQALLTGGQSDWLTTLLNRRQVKVHVYHCSGRAARVADVTDPLDPKETAAAIEKIRGLRAEGESSQLGTAVRQVLNDFRGSSLSAVVMLTDGVTTEGEDLVKVARYASHMGVPLFFVGIGDAHEVRDLKLHDLQVEDAVYVNDRLVFEVRLTGQGYTDLTVLVSLREKGKDKILAEQMVKVDPQGQPVKIRLLHQPAEPGEKTYVIEVPVQPDEVQPADNNKLERTVFVRQSKLIKVLYVEGYARYEYRFLKNLLERENAEIERNKSIDLKVFLLDADAGYLQEDKSAIAEFPSKVELAQFDVVIFGDVDPTDDKVKAHLKDVADFVRERGGGFLMIAGERYSPFAYKDGPLRDILPIEVAGPQSPDTERTEGYRPELTPVGRFHPIFRFSPDEAENTAIWNRLAELYWWAEGYRSKWGAEVLAVHPRMKAQAGGPAPAKGAGADSGLHPLLLQQFIGGGRSMFFGIDETWRWRFREDELRFNQFWIQTVRYLSRNRLGRVDLRLDRQTPYRRGEPIKVMVRFPDDGPPPAPEMEVKVVVERTLLRPGSRGETEVQTLPLAKVEGSRATYAALLGRTPEGEYRFWLSSPMVTGYKPRAECRVIAPPGEMDRLRMNREEMERAAEETQGRFYTLANAEQVLDDLPSGTRLALNARQPPRLLWNHAAMFALALGFLTTEWILRKRRHLL